MAATPVEAQEPQFSDVFNQFIETVANVHGREVALTYRTLREQEAMVLLNTAAPAGPLSYPDAPEQLKDFLSFRIATE